MSYFGTIQNEQNLGTFEMGGGDLEPIPKGTQLLAMVDEAQWREYEGVSHVSLRWTVAQPEQYKNRKVYQKIHMEDADQGKRARALRMLAAIDANTGGHIVAAGVRPTDQQLQQHLMNSPMVIKVEVWESEDKSKSGNWIQSVAPYVRGQQQAAPASAPKPATPLPANPAAALPEAPAAAADPFNVPF